jgi:hypothetical protein
MEAFKRTCRASAYHVCEAAAEAFGNRGPRPQMCGSPGPQSAGLRTGPPKVDSSSFGGQYVISGNGAATPPAVHAGPTLHASLPPCHTQGTVLWGPRRAGSRCAPIAAAGATVAYSGGCGGIQQRVRQHRRRRGRSAWTASLLGPANATDSPAVHQGNQHSAVYPIQAGHGGST